VLRDAWRRAARYAAVYFVAGILLGLLPGGRYGTAATIVVVALGTAVLVAYVRGYLRLRRTEQGPFIGSRRAADLLIVLFALPALAALAVLELTSGDGIAIAAAVVCVCVWLVVGTVMVVSERKRAARGGWAVWPPTRDTGGSE
jgi:hypothetical protein